MGESERPFLLLARGLYAVGHAVYCDEPCAHVHDGHGCEHDGHACGCEHDALYEFEFSGLDVDDPAAFLQRLAQFTARLPLPELSAREIEARLEWWWRGENRALRKAMESIHRTRCERGRGVLINRITGEVTRARCKSWRDCEYCAWVYGHAVQKLWEQLKCVRAFVVFTMPPERGDWSKRENIRAQALAKRRLEERLFRKFGHRFALAWAREHNTHGSGTGRLHLNVLWDENWVDQAWLSETAQACGFGRIANISRVGTGARLRDGEGRGKPVHRYALKALRYATKDAASQADRPKGTRRWGASRAARAQMKRPDRNPDWYWSPDASPANFMPFDVNRYKPARADGCLCCLCNGRGSHAGGLGCFACVCGAWSMAGSPRERLSRAELAVRARSSPDPPAA